MAVIGPCGEQLETLFAAVRDPLDWAPSDLLTVCLTARRAADLGGAEAVVRYAAARAGLRCLTVDPTAEAFVLPAAPRPLSSAAAAAAKQGLVVLLPQPLRLYAALTVPAHDAVGGSGGGGGPGDPVVQLATRLRRLAQQPDGPGLALVGLTTTDPPRAESLLVDGAAAGQAAAAAAASEADLPGRYRRLFAHWLALPSPLPARAVPALAAAWIAAELGVPSPAPEASRGPGGAAPTAWTTAKPQLDAAMGAAWTAAVDAGLMAPEAAGSTPLHALPLATRTFVSHDAVRRLAARWSRPDAGVATGDAVAVAATTVPRGPVDAGGWTLDDYGGFDVLKQTLVRLFRPPSADVVPGSSAPPMALLYGPPGTGKTLMARCLAGALGLELHVLSLPRLMHGAIGESERAIDGVFATARRAASTAPRGGGGLIFIDEMDAAFPRHSATAEFHAKLTWQLAANLDELAAQTARLRRRHAAVDGDDDEDGDDEDAEDDVRGGGGWVGVLGATNHPDALAPELLRPGRIGTHLRMRPPQTTADVAGTLAVALTRALRDADVGGVVLVDGAAVPAAAWAAAAAATAAAAPETRAALDATCAAVAQHWRQTGAAVSAAAIAQRVRQAAVRARVAHAWLETRELLSDPSSA